MACKDIFESKPNRRMPNGTYGGVGGKEAKENLSLPDLPDLGGKNRLPAEKLRQAMMYVSMIDDAAPTLNDNEQAAFAAYDGFIPQEPWSNTVFDNFNKEQYD